MKTVVWPSLANLRVAEIAKMVAEYADERSAIRYVSKFKDAIWLLAIYSCVILCHICKFILRKRLPT